jgi:acetyltransferase-like isoleucine patch superfamily enzyme
MIIRIKFAIINRINSVKTILVNFFILKVLKQPHYLNTPNANLFVNFIFQRIFGINRDIPFSVSFTSRYQGFKNIKLPKNSDSIKLSMAVSGGCYFSVFDGSLLEIGENSLWASNVCIQTGNHDLMNRNQYSTASIKIGENCWIGNSVTILKGVELGDNVTVAANSVVTKSFPSNVVIAGVPAKIIKYID